MYSELLLFIISIGYLGVLFGVAYWTEYKIRPFLKKNRSKNKVKNRINNFYKPLIYALSMGVYCTAWTFYGSVGQAATSGLGFLSTYIGPLLTIPLWWFVLRKIIKISKAKGITTLADFISARYGKSIALGRLITVLCVFGVVPYISIQIQAISMSIEVLTTPKNLPEQTTSFSNFWISDTALYATLILGFFTMLFTTRNLQSDNKNRGMIAAIAFESIIKLITFLGVGFFIIYGMFDGMIDIFEKTASNVDLQKLTIIQHKKSSGEWFWYLLLSALAIFLLPRQFQVSVVENEDEKHIIPAMWIFALYLLVINFFVLPIALGGKIWFEGTNFVLNSDMFMLSLPLDSDYPQMALFSYIGGFSASTSMIIVSTAALSTMISNNLLLPNWVSDFDWKNPSFKAIKTIKWFRRLGILLILFLAYLYFKMIGELSSLVSIGMVSFAAIAQLAPAFFGGVFWKRGTKHGAFVGIIIGFFIWAYTLILPFFIQSGYFSSYWVSDSSFLQLLNPHALFGMDYLDSISQSVFWSLFLNSFFYVIVSIMSIQSASERNEAEIFVDIFKYSTRFESAVLWKGKAYFSEVKELLNSFLGKKRTHFLLENYAKTNTEKKEEFKNDPLPHQEKIVLADSRLLTLTERMLSNVVGSVSARILVSSLLHEQETVAMEEVITILKESQDVLSTNRELRQKSNELRRLTEELETSNQKLKEQDRIKDDFVSTVTHELRTPITAIRALSEILYQNPDLEEEERQSFLESVVNECQRLSFLINEILDIESFDNHTKNNTLQLDIREFDLKKSIYQVYKILKPLAEQKNINIEAVCIKNDENIIVEADEKRIEQAIINLVSNAINHMKFNENEIPIDRIDLKANKSEFPLYKIKIETKIEADFWQISIIDNGKGISKENQVSIFEKFHQIRDKNNRKPKGTGLGLSIAKRIIEAHITEKTAKDGTIQKQNGQIWVESKIDRGTTFVMRFAR
ncbi:Na+/proline symporter [Bernardetia litoralis DSM 6794]|uniref:histidine kinase n=1 Tax=Bernardetia litoralis (strain ATCC 23117 / DSM 6794 / NBRC 15988 / NCIMB 1366 / Fx l1 / Sio-4) TaxID=880071 RepID=I4AP40_BERLS|nr:sensor histidine kinase [Bernardetia litoralis]AFM05725.1 Na+/proline symporter [Bernardetia litoralis DSM 6794]